MAARRFYLPASGTSPTPSLAVTAIQSIVLGG